MSENKSNTHPYVAGIQSCTHEVRNHLSSILAGARMLAKRADDPEFVGGIASMIEKEIVDATQVLTRMVNLRLEDSSPPNEN